MRYTRGNNMHRLLGPILLITLALSPTQIANAAAVNKKISDTMPSFGDVDYTFAKPQISPDGRYVVYVADQLTDGMNELFSVPVTGNALPARISGPLPAGGQVDQFSISPDSTQVVYLVVGTDGMGDNYTELYSAPLTSGTATKLSGTLGEVNPSSQQISPDGLYVLYQAKLLGVTELYSSPIAGGAVTKLSGNLVSGGSVASFSITPDGNRVVYYADQETDEVYELYSVPITGGSPVKLNAALANGALGTLSFRISPNSHRVAYAAQQDTAGVAELYSVSITGGVPVRLNDPLAIGTQVYMYNIQISPDSSQVLYIANQQGDGSFGLYSALIAGGTPTRLITTTTYGLLSPFFISPSGNWVVCVGCHNGDGINSIYTLPIGGGTPIKLNAAATPGDSVNSLQISPNSNWVVYRATQGLYSVPITGEIATKLSNPLLPGGTSSVSDYRISPDNSRVIFRGTLRALDLNEVYSVPLAGGIATVLNGTPLNGTDVMNFQLSPDSRYVVYVADQNTDDVFELYVSYEEIRVFLPFVQR